MTTRPQASCLSENISTRQASTTALPLMSRSPRLPVSCLAGTQELYRNSTFLSTHGLKPSTTSLTPGYLSFTISVSRYFTTSAPSDHHVSRSLGSSHYHISCQSRFADLQQWW
ncbi:hypothetical protein L2E82_11781 [Cichorium intybus]|uniref:Uncharacterized protein n=1 Tax=Cichorium intybus TaxID=13427 RepID=A0ACB9GEF2_CICIN|nr:hypothetical protein L2E82_11781 [Cichorium intybus]